MNYYVHKNHITELEICKSELGLQAALDKMVVGGKGFGVVTDFATFSKEDMDALDVFDVEDTENLVKRMEYINTYELYTMKDGKVTLYREGVNGGYDLEESVTTGNRTYYEELGKTIRDSLETKKSFRVVDADASEIDVTIGTKLDKYVFIGCGFDDYTMGVLATYGRVTEVDNALPVAEIKERIGKDNAIVCIREDKVMPGFLKELEDAGIPCAVVVPCFWDNEEE
ncbi:hypothetical protein FT641_18710 [Bacillus paranthracis]|uniref:hypothetical protein n=1 Tax=Bacillus paranthracis TaxID=2026186 RepID=UPI0018790800|nr:hypothetical protein [Bacillus paranthracis]MBE7114403.1 hypothetical protein [Bacillus paranthracis]MBE7154723.1 hypothetical protein [Bacillus paranthracis]